MQQTEIDDNLLLRPLGPIMDLEETMIHLFSTVRFDISEIRRLPLVQRLRYLLQISDIYVPSGDEVSLYQSIHMMICEGYRHRNPRVAQTWTRVTSSSERASNAFMLSPPLLVTTVSGIPGVGKTKSCLRCMNLCGPQISYHEKFPQLSSGLTQPLWMSVEVPASGKASDFAKQLMSEWDHIMGTSRFQSWLCKEHIPNGIMALNEWLQNAKSHFLGVLHIDEVQNLFKLRSLRSRSQKNTGSNTPELSIVEDQLLKWILYFTNKSGIPLLLSGTPDGIGALFSRMSTLQRTGQQYHQLKPFDMHNNGKSSDLFLEALESIQLVDKPLKIDTETSMLIHKLSGGIPRIIVALWVAAHRVAFQEASKELLPAHLIEASNTYLLPLREAIDALVSNDPNRLRRYEDMIFKVDPETWQKIWRFQST